MESCDPSSSVVSLPAAHPARTKSDPMQKQIAVRDRATEIPFEVWLAAARPAFTTAISGLGCRVGARRRPTKCEPVVGDASRPDDGGQLLINPFSVVRFARV